MYEISLHYNSGRIETVTNAKDWKQHDGFLLVSFSDRYSEAYNLAQVKCVTFLEDKNVQK